jgi:hypothetical protein
MKRVDYHSYPRRDRATGSKVYRSRRGTIWPMRFTVTMLCEPGKPMLTFVDEKELARRKNRRAPRTN